MPYSWIDQFVRQYGRPPRILHIGNIANNAYQISKMLNAVGAQSDVLCYDYYHCMGCPEWDDADFTGDIGDPFFPRWDKVDLHGFERPRWFAQGPMEVCVKYLISHREGNTAKSNRLWRALKRSQKQPQRKTLSAFGFKLPFDPIHMIRRFFSLLFTDPSLFWEKCKANLSGRIKAERMRKWRAKPLEERYPEWAGILKTLRDDATRCFPDRKMEFGEECLMYFANIPLFEKLFRQYDIVQAYADCPIIPYLTGFKNYIAFEHGSIRDLPYEDNVRGRLMLLSYANAKAVYVTNIDCVDSAKYITKHSQTNIVFGLHGIDINRMQKRIRDAIAQSKNYTQAYRFGAPPDERVFFCPSRHDIDPQRRVFIKGDEKLIQAAGKLAEEFENFRLVLLNFGQDIDKLKAMINQYPTLIPRIVWCEPMGKAQLYQTFHYSDCILDQFLLPAFGAITIEALCVGGGVLVSQKISDEQMEDFFGCKLPTYQCDTADEIFFAMRQVMLDPQEARRRAELGREWIQKYHSNQRIVTLLEEAFACCSFSEGL